VLVGACAVAVVLGIIIWAQLQSSARLDASARVVGTGVDPDDYWYARVEFTNTGTLPWYIVDLSQLSIVGDPGFSLEVGSTVPYDEIPSRFEVVVEARRDGVIPAQLNGLALHLGVVSAEPWYLWQHKTGGWSFELPL
jgi:hypothetical protein